MYDLMKDKFKYDVELYIKILHGPDCELRELAAWVLGLSGDERAIKPLISVLERRDLCALEKAVLALGRLGNQKAVPALSNVLSDKSLDENYDYHLPNVRGFAASSLGKINAKEAAKILIDALKDSQTDVRSRAAKSLGNVGNETAIEPLINVILQDKNNEVQWCAAESLGKIGNSSALAPLNQVLDEHSIIADKARKAIEAIKERLNQ